MRHRFNAKLFIALVAASVAACGGGGGGDGGADDDPWGDGLGSTGQSAGTVAIATAEVSGTPSVTLDDSGRALVVWSNRAGAGEDPAFGWNRRTVDGQ